MRKHCSLIIEVEIFICLSFVHSLRDGEFELNALDEFPDGYRTQ